MKLLVYLFGLMVLFVPAIAGAINVGVGSYINSAGVDANQSSIASLLGDSGSQWTRMEIPYDLNYDFSLLDGALAKASDKGVKVLLLFAHKDGLTSDQFESWVDTVVSRGKDKIDAYEIFNEIDNTLSATQYKPFLEKAYNKIKAIDSSATVVASGLTGRKEAIDYWNALYDAGGKPYFDVLGIHPYRTSSPETKEFNNGSQVDSINQAVASINAHGGGKKVWITEFGWQSGSVGESSQGNLLARGFLLSATVEEVDNIISYRLADNDVSTSYGIANSSFDKKSSFSSVSTAIGKLKGASFSERVDAVTKSSIDNFDGGVSGWKDEGSSSGNVSLSAASGRSGGGMKFSWTFSAGNGYVIASKPTTLNGEPKGLALWINGDNQTSVWKLRIKDNNGETFQFDLGQAPSGWKQYTFDFNNDKAKTSWAGDGKIDYPIKFDSVVLDNQNGSTAGSATIDDVEAWHGDTDLYALRFGGTLAYWKASGSASATVCGQELSFVTAPKYTSVSASSCSSTAASSSPSSESSSGTTSATTLDKDKSELIFDKSTALADGKDTMSGKMYLKDTGGGVFQSSKVTITVSGKGNTVSKPKFTDGDHYQFTVKSTVAEEKTITVKVGSTVVATQKVTFTAVDAPAPAISTEQKPTEAAPAPTAETATEPTPELTVSEPVAEIAAQAEEKSFPTVPVAAGAAVAAFAGLGVAANKFGWAQIISKIIKRG